MKRIVMFLFILLVIWLYTRCASKIETLEGKDDRKSITFIMSNDKPGKSYYSLATEYFSKHITAKTDLITAECRTVSCVIERLNRLEKGKWSEVNLVAHGNSKTGLNIYLKAEGQKATPKHLVQEVLLKNLPELSYSVVDTHTNINVFSCGVGTNPLITHSIERIFHTDTFSPNVNCAEKYIVFRPDSNGIVQMIEANYWPYYYRRGYRPSASEITAEMKQIYPSVKKNWAKKLEGTQVDQLQSMDYHIPVSFTKIYEDKHQRPNFDSEMSKMKWVRGQLQIKSQLADLEMGYDDFHWSVDKRIITDEKGIKKYAVKAIGMSTVLCFLDF